MEQLKLTLTKIEVYGEERTAEEVLETSRLGFKLYNEYKGLKFDNSDYTSIEDSNGISYGAHYNEETMEYIMVFSFGSLYFSNLTSTNTIVEPVEPKTETLTIELNQATKDFYSGASIYNSTLEDITNTWSADNIKALIQDLANSIKHEVTLKPVRTLEDIEGEMEACISDLTYIEIAEIWERMNIENITNINGYYRIENFDDELNRETPWHIAEMVSNGTFDDCADFFSYDSYSLHTYDYDDLGREIHYSDLAQFTSDIMENASNTALQITCGRIDKNIEKLMKEITDNFY